MMRSRQVFAFALVLGMASVCRATPVSFTFTTLGGNPGISGLQTVGSGSLTVNAGPGTASTLSAFAYTVTGSNSGGGTGTATFGLGDVTSFKSTVTGTADAPVIASFLLKASENDGAYLTLYGPQSPAFSGGPRDFPSIGQATYTEVPSGGTATTPEPASFLLLGSGLLGVAGVTRRRLA